MIYPEREPSISIWERRERKLSESDSVRRAIGVKYVISAALLACLFLSTPFFSFVEAIPVQEYDMSIPPQYQVQYTELQNILNSFNSSLGPYPASMSSLAFATELLPANGNRGPALFQSNNLASVTRNLNALQAMGVRGVTIAIGYPLLDPSFPNSAQYLNYFQQVVSMAHAHGMKVLIESQILFANTLYSPLTYNWANLPYSQYVTNHIAQDQLIINQIHPDYLELGVEADTEAYLTGYSQLNTPSGWNSYIEQLLSSLNKGNTKLVAGAATWIGTSFLTGFANDPRLDMISTHVYPLYGNNLQTLIQIGTIAQQNNKPVVVDEAWDHKHLQRETSGGTGIGGPAANQQDVFAYWSPIDIQFLSLMAKFSQIYHVQYLSPFPEDYFFAYLNWTPSLDSQSYFQLMPQLEPIVYQNMASNTLSPTGAAYSALAHGAISPLPEFPNTLLALTVPLLALTVAFAILQTRKTCQHLPHRDTRSPPTRAILYAG
jgi:hypothetical protein